MVFSLVNLQRENLKKDLASDLQKIGASSPEDLLDEKLSKIVSELPAKRKLLEDITKQMKDVGETFDNLVGNVASLSQHEFIQMFGQLDLCKCNHMDSCETLFCENVNIIYTGCYL